MANIKDIVAKSFESTRDFRISQQAETAGASSILSATYSKEDAEERKFYSKPELAEGEETKLAILYGEVLITPYLIDSGTTAGTNDPESILKTVRFIAGDGETEGVVVGPNGSQLENVYIGGDDETPQPVIDSDGRPSTKDVILASLLGGAVSSIPSIWDALTDDAPEENKIDEIDPVTGAPIKTQAQREKEATIGQNLILDDLANADESGLTAVDSVLFYDTCEGMWIPKSFSEILTDIVTIEGVRGGKGGTGGEGGKGGWGGKGGDAGNCEQACPPDGPIIDPEPCEPECEAPKGNLPLSGKQELLSSYVDENNVFKFNFDIKGTSGVQFHFYTPKLSIVCPCEQSRVDGDTGSNTTTVYLEEESVIKLQMWVTTTVKGEEYFVSSADVIYGGKSNTSLTFASEMLDWNESTIGVLMEQFPNDVDTNFNFYVQRIDDICSENSNTEPVYFEGLALAMGYIGPYQENEPGPDEYDPAAEPGAVESHCSTVPTEEFMEDDGIFPTIAPPSGTFIPPDTVEPPPDPEPCEPEIICEGSVGEEGLEGGTGSAGFEGEEGLEGTITITPAENIPILELEDPSSRTYGKDENDFWVPVALASALDISSQNGDPNVTLTYKVIKGAFTFEVDGDPIGVTVEGETTRELTLTGLESNIPQATSFVDLIPDDGAAGNLIYIMTLKNSSGYCNTKMVNVLPTSLVIDSNESGCAFFTLDVDTDETGDIRVFAEVPAGGEKELTIDPVNKFAGDTVEQYAQIIAETINNDVAENNAYPQEDPLWVPLYTASAQGAMVKVCSPPEGGEDFNDLKLRTEETGDVDIDWDFTIPDFFGGITKNISDFFTDNPTLGSVGDVLLGIGGNVAGAVITNMIMNNSSSLQISFPEEDADVTVTFLYRGRKVNVPAEYDETGRSGTPDYANFSGSWKNVWTDSPAWCLLDYLENKKYGLGNDIVLTTAQKELLLDDIFEVSKYCDEVADGAPRFSLNTAITDGTKLEILEQLCSVFFGSYVFHNGGLRIKADRLDNEIALLVSQANAGDFTYEHTTLKSFVNTVNVTYLEPDTFYAQAIVTAENTLGVAKYGAKTLDLFGFGITNKAQALRYANWVLNSEMENSLLVSYDGGWDHFKLVPGDIVQFEDSNERGERLAGRVKSVNGTSVITDGAVIVNAGDDFSVTQEDGSIWTTSVSSVTSDTEFTISSSPVRTVLPYSTFIIADQIIGKQLYRVVKVDETTDGSFGTTLQLYNTDKYNKIQALTRAI